MFLNLLLTNFQTLHTTLHTEEDHTDLTVTDLTVPEWGEPGNEANYTVDEFIAK